MDLNKVKGFSQFCDFFVYICTPFIYLDSIISRLPDVGYIHINDRTNVFISSGENIFGRPYSYRLTVY